MRKAEPELTDYQELLKKVTVARTTVFHDLEKRLKTGPRKVSHLLVEPLRENLALLGPVEWSDVGQPLKNVSRQKIHDWREAGLLLDREEIDIENIAGLLIPSLVGRQPFLPTKPV